MPWRRALVVVLACLTWGAASPTVACNHHASTASEALHASKKLTLANAAGSQHLAPVAKSGSEFPVGRWPGSCVGACCCHGGMTSCSAGHISGPATIGFDLFRSARCIRLAWAGDQSVPYRDPRYGLDRPPKA